MFVLERGGHGPGGFGCGLLDAARDGVSGRGGPVRHAAAVHPAAEPVEPAHGGPAGARPRARAGSRPDEAVVIPQVSPAVSGQRGRDRVTVLCHRRFIELATQTKLLLTTRLLPTAASNNFLIVSELLSYTLVPTTYLISVVKMAIYITLTCYM